MTNAFMHWARTLVGPQRFISGSVILSLNRRLVRQPVQTSGRLAKLLAFGEHRCAGVRASMGILPAFRWLSSEMKGSFRTDWQRPASFGTFGAPISDISQLICQIS